VNHSSNSNVVGRIIDGTCCLYIASFDASPVNRQKFNFGSIIMYFILWEDRAVWVSSTDCELHDIDDRDI